MRYNNRKFYTKVKMLKSTSNAKAVSCVAVVSVHSKLKPSCFCIFVLAGTQLCSIASRCSGNESALRRGKTDSSERRKSILEHNQKKTGILHGCWGSPNEQAIIDRGEGIIRNQIRLSGWGTGISFTS